MKKIKLEEGQVWQVPDKKWIRVRVIIKIFNRPSIIRYVELGDSLESHIRTKYFLRWIRRNKAKIIGIRDFKTGKVRATK